MNNSDTIYALATPAGKSGVAIIRLSGSKALDALELLAQRHGFTPRYAHFVTLTHPDTHYLIDKGLALYFAAPNSFTGEDVVELHLHGSLGVIREMLEVLSNIEGLRPAERGEFTRKAYLNGKMDLIQAEGLADLIDAETKEQRRLALGQMGGSISDYYREMRLNIISALAHLEAYIDFPDEDIPESVLHGLGGKIHLIQNLISKALSDSRRGERIRDGVTIAILGAPNVGKSSLMNVLAGRDVAIVSEKAGTTRDTIEIHMDFAGYPAVVIDTAGIRESSDDIEAEGVRRALVRAESADIRLLLFDAENWPDKDTATHALIDESAILIVSKADSVMDIEQGVIAVSAKTGAGIGELLDTIKQRIINSFSNEGIIVTRERHRMRLNEALSHLNRFFEVEALELKCEELRRAATCIGQITGKIAVDDVLDVVFNEFCIGK